MVGKVKLSFYLGQLFDLYFSSSGANRTSKFREIRYLVYYRVISRPHQHLNTSIFSFLLSEIICHFVWTDTTSVYNMYSQAVSRLIWRLCGGNTVAFLRILLNFACSVCLDLHSLICCSLGRNKGLTLNGSTVSTTGGLLIGKVIFLCAWTHIYYLYKEIP